MSLRRTLLLAALISMAPTAMVIAQTTSPSDTSPSSASSPSQRDSTSSSSSEAPTKDSTSPAAASTPHQQQAVKGSRTASKQSMKDCIAKQQADNSGMSAADAKKACKAQMKANSG
jgi:cytoskeletal protein RodZ